MSLTDSSFDVVDDSANLPKYSNHHKFILIEELLLAEDYTQLHYGRCRVIGKVLKEVTNDFYLENIQISNLPEEYSLPEGTLKLHLLTSACAHPSLENGKYVEVLGEVILIDPEETITHEAQPLTSRGVLEQLNFLADPNEEEKLLNHFNKNYKPALKVWYISQINRPGDLISRNLEIRMLLEQTLGSL